MRSGTLPPARLRDDAGGAWIAVGWVVGGLAYAGVVVMAVAGASAVLPLVIVPPVLIALIGAGNLLGGRRHGRTAVRSAGPEAAPVPSGGSDGPLVPEPPGGTRAGEAGGHR